MRGSAENDKPIVIQPMIAKPRGMRKERIAERMRESCRPARESRKRVDRLVCRASGRSAGEGRESLGSDAVPLQCRVLFQCGPFMMVLERHPKRRLHAIIIAVGFLLALGSEIVYSILLATPEGIRVRSPEGDVASALMLQMCGLSIMLLPVALLSNNPRRRQWLFCILYAPWPLSRLWGELRARQAAARPVGERQ